MEEHISTFKLTMIVILLVVIIPGAYLVWDYSRCSSSCVQEQCKVSRCEFGVKGIGFSCEKYPIPNCCGNSICESSETKCTCAKDCGACMGLANKCEEFYCNPDSECIANFVRNCCGNGVCEIVEDYKKCPDDCTLQNNGTSKGYDGPEEFDKMICGETAFSECEEGKYDVYDKNNHIIVGFNFPQYNLNNVTKGTARFYAYVKKEPGEDSKRFISVTVNGIYVGDMQIDYSSWDSPAYGFKWESVGFPITKLKKGYNTFKLEGDGWYAIARYNNSYMTKVAWNIR